MLHINSNIHVVVSRSYCEIRLSVVNERPRDLSDVIRFSMTIWMASTLCSPVNVLVITSALNIRDQGLSPLQRTTFLHIGYTLLLRV